MLVQLYFALFRHLKLSSFQIVESYSEELEPISVVLCSRNDIDKLRKYLPAIMAQKYPNFEVIVVNDRSWDGTGDFLEEFQKNYDRLKVVTVSEGEKFIAGKKFALTMGIKAASHDWLVLTDADCLPSSENWLSSMRAPNEATKEIILGYSPYMKRRSLLNIVIRLETFFTAVNYLSFAITGMPYMGVGRNLAYKKSLFFKSKGFASHMDVPSGDDDLFINANANSKNTLIQIHKDSQVWSEPKTGFFSYIKQKKRHYGAGKRYKGIHRFMLTIQYLSNLFFHLLALLLLFFPETHLISAGIIVANAIIRSIIYAKLLSRLSYAELRWWFWILEWILALFLVLNGIVSIFVKKVTWK